MIKTIPIRLDYYQYCTETWGKIFEELDFKKVKTIIDFCPGWSPKLELALLKTDFNGVLYAIDKSQDNLCIFKSLIDPFPKKFTVEYINSDILNFGNKFNSLSADLILANHIVDDMVLDMYLKNNNLKIKLFENQTQMKKTWQQILKRENIFTQVQKDLKNVLAQRLNPGGYLLLAQYLGYQENLFGLKGVYRKCRKIFEDVKIDLCEFGGFINKNKLLASAFLKIKSPYFPKNDIFCLKKS